MLDVNAAIGGAPSAVTGRMIHAIAMRMNHITAVFMLSHPKNSFFWTQYQKKPAYLHPYGK
jgi:H+/gluconate symporter-like permease